MNGSLRTSELCNALGAKRSDVKTLKQLRDQIRDTRLKGSLYSGQQIEQLLTEIETLYGQNALREAIVDLDLQWAFYV